MRARFSSLALVGAALLLASGCSRGQSLSVAAEASAQAAPQAQTAARPAPAPAQRPATPPAAPARPATQTRPAAQTAAKPPAQDDDLPLLSWVCPTAGHEGVIEDKPGTCPIDHKQLVPIRLDIAYSCLKVSGYVYEKQQKCEVDGTPTVPVTASVSWKCKDSTTSLEPHKCSDGTAALKSFQVRPHGDHNPRHGGKSVFMSPDQFHHVEGTLLPGGIFRAYFYNEFTRPMSVTGFSARVAVADKNNKETGMPIALVPSKIKDGNAMEAKIPGLPVPSEAAPVYVKLRMHFKPGDMEWPTDHDFVAYSKEPAGGAPVAAAAPKPAAPPASATKPAAAPPSASGMQGSTIQLQPDIVSAPPNPRDLLPTSMKELLAELKKQADSVQDLLSQRQLGGVWFPALGAKDVAIKLEELHLNDLPEAQRPTMSGAVKELTVVAWQIDAAGDLGNNEKLQELYEQFAAAVAEIQALYGSAR